MQTTVEETDKHVVRLTVEVPPEEFAKDLDRTYRKIAGEVKIPGFRKGHVPRPIIDARVGRDTVFHEFVEDFLPTYYSRRSASTTWPRSPIPTSTSPPRSTSWTPASRSGSPRRSRSVRG